MKHFFLVLVFIASLWANQTNKIIVDDTTKHLRLTPFISYYLDTTATLDEHTIDSSNINFNLSNKEQLSFGHNFDSTLWIAFSIENNSSNTKTYLIEYANYFVTNFTIYKKDGSFVDSSNIKDLDKLNKNIGQILHLKLEANTTQTYYIKIQNSVSSMTVHLDLWDKDEYMSQKNKYWNIVSLLLGAMFILALYNLMLFFFTKDRSYIYYVLLNLGVLYHEMAITGYIIFLPEFMIPEDSAFIHWMVLATFIFIPIFARSFLQLETIMPRSDKYLKYIPLFLILVTIATVYEIMPVIINRIFIIFFIASVILIAIIALYKGVKQARYYVFGWSVLFVAFAMMALHRIGVLEFNPNEFHITQSAVLFEALIFSVGLAARIRYVKEEKESSDAKLILHQQEEKTRLEAKVIKRTEELTKALSLKNLLLKEVHHRVKNNMQIIISLLRLQSDLLDDEKLQDAMSISEQRIKAMGSVHEMLYASDDISEIDSKVYFSMLVEEVHNAYDINDNIEVDIETDAKLSIDNAIYVGLIVNELVINSFKHAFTEDGGKINIELMMKSNQYHLTISDNGRGGEVLVSDSSLGMMLVKTLVSKQLKGSIATSTTDGVSHLIIFPKESNES